MTTTLDYEPQSEMIEPSAGDEVLYLLQRIARRADFLSCGSHMSRERDRTIWLRAEFEVFEHLERARPAVLAPVDHPWINSPAETAPALPIAPLCAASPARESVRPR